MHRSFPLLLLLVAASFLFAGCVESWDAPGVKIEGTTASEKLASIADAVSKEHDGKIAAVYIEPDPSAPGFIVALTVPRNSITTPQKATELQNALNDSLATILRLTATEVLPGEPSIRYVGVAVVIAGNLQEYFAVAADLKAMPSDAPQSAWLAKLQPVSNSSNMGTSGAAPVPQSDTGNSDDTGN